MAESVILIFSFLAGQSYQKGEKSGREKKFMLIVYFIWLLHVFKFKLCEVLLKQIYYFLFKDVEIIICLGAQGSLEPEALAIECLP